MPNNLVVQLLLKTGAFSDDLKTARGQIQNFQKGCSTAGKAVSGFSEALGINIGGIAKFGGVVGIAVAAGKEFKNILESSQTTSDALAGAIAGCKGAVDSFRTAIASRDFTLLSDGLWSAYNAAKAVQDALDQLANTQIAYDYKSAKNQTKFQEAYTMYKDPESTPEMKEEAKKKMKEAVDAQFTYASNYSSALYKSYVAQVVQKAGTFNLPANNVTPSQFEKAMDIDLGLLGDPGKMRAYYKNRYGEYLDKIGQYDKSFLDRLKDLNIGSDKSLWSQLFSGDEYNNLTAIENLKKEYKDDIAINAMLQLMSDGKLTGIGQLLTDVEQAQKLAISMDQTMNRAIKGEFSSSSKGSTGGKGSTTTTVGQEELKPQEGSLDYWQNILAEETKYRDALKNDTEEWKQHNDKVKEATEKIKEIKEAEEEREKYTEGSLNYLNDLLNKLKNQKDNLSPNTEEWDNVSKKIAIIERLIENIGNKNKLISLENAMSVQPPTIASLREVIRLLTELRDNFPIGSELFNEYADEIKYYEKLLKLATPNTVDTGVVDEDKKWQSFNQTMANTSTIANALFNTFKEGSEITAASILQMISTTLPAIGSLISAISALTSAEAVEAGVAATGKAVSTSKHWIEAIAAVASLGAVVATAISAASKPNLQRFADGGIVGGSSFTGDRVSAMVNSGEMILNKTQQARLFKIANGGAPGDNAVTFHISGTDLVGVLNNNSRKNKLIR